MESRCLSKKKVFLGSRERSPESDVWMKEEMVKQEKRKGIHLIVGGAFQGKTAYAKSAYPDLRWCDGSVCEMDDIWEAEGILHLEAWISRWMRGEENKARQQKEKDKLSGGRGSRSAGQTADRDESGPGDRVHGNRIRSGSGRCI